MFNSSYSNVSDDELLTHIREDKQSALEELFSRYYDSLCNFSFRYARDFSITEEIVSDVFLKIWLKRHSITIKSNLKAYLFSATRNQALNYLRREKEDSIDFDEVADQFESSKFRADYSVRSSDLANHLETLMDSLTPRRAQVFRLSRIEGFKYKEIADILSISVNTVQNHMVKAVKQLSTHLIKD